jgi:hypothetical protein
MYFGVFQQILSRLDFSNWNRMFEMTLDFVEANLAKVS